MRPGAHMLAGAAALLIAAAPVAAQSSTRIPDVPAFVFLGVAPSDIARPTTAREFALGLANVMDSLGRARQGAGVNFQPWFTFGAPVTRQRYRTSWRWYALANLDVSLGTARSAGSDTTSTDLALGAKTVFFDRADPLASHAIAAEIGKVARERCPIDKFTDPATGLDDPKKRLECLVSKTDSVYEAARRRNELRGPSLAAAFAVGSTLGQSRLEDARFAGVSGWVTFATPFSRSGELVLQTRFDRRNAADSTTNVFSTGARATLGGARTSAFAELLGSWADRGQDRSSAKWSAGVEVLGAQDLWLAVGFGSTFATQYGKDPTRLIANIRWAVAPSPRLRADNLPPVP